MPKEFKAILWGIGLLTTTVAFLLVVLASPFVKISQLLGHKYWQW